jgi:uncharacterized coiled-coil protein SlyX
MKPIRLLVPLVLVLAACDPQAKEQLKTLAHADSLRTDSLVNIKNELLNEVMASTQFVNDISTEMAKLKSRSTKRLATRLTPESDLTSIKESRATVVAKITELVARLDSSEARLASIRVRAASLSKRDAKLAAQVAEYEKTIADLRMTVEQQKSDFQAIIDRQNTQIAALTSRVDTVTSDNVRLTGERAALTDTVSQLTTERNTAYYVIGTKDELIEKGVLVEEGHKRFLLVGGRPVAPARDLDPTKFTKIDRLKDRVINFPEGTYTIFSRQSAEFASPLEARDGKLAGGLRIEQPDRFWEASRFLIVIKS